MCFAWPDNLVYLLLLIPLAVLFGYGFMRQLQSRELFAGRGMIRGPGRRRLLFGRMLHFSAIALLLFALAGPQLCRGQRVIFRKGADLVFMLDVSTSMLAADVPPDRLERAKDAALRISSQVRDGRRALLLFAAAPLVQCPLTHDRDAFEALIAMASPVLVEEQGTSFAPAFQQALELFAVPSSTGGEGRFRSERIVVLLSDGEDHTGGATAAAAKLGQTGVTLFVLGVGGRGDALIADPFHPGEVKRDRDGNAVKTRFSPLALRQVARASGGAYFDTAGGDAVYDDVAGRINRIVAGSRLVSVPADGFPLYHYVLGAGLLLLLFERLLAAWRSTGMP